MAAPFGRTDIHESIPPTATGVEALAQNPESTTTTTAPPDPQTGDAATQLKSQAQTHQPVTSSGQAPDPVPEMADPQQAATAPGTGGTVDSSEKLPFKEAVNGYAKKFAGTVFGNKEEKEWGEAKLRGEV